jgi:hypothetical protein
MATAALSSALRSLVQAESESDSDDASTEPGGEELPTGAEVAVGAVAKALRAQGVEGDLSAYTPEMLAKRRALRADAAVRELLLRWFDEVAGPKASSSDPPDGRVVDRTAYGLMWGALVDFVGARRKVGGSSAKLRRGVDADLAHAERMEKMKQTDWKNDSSNGLWMTLSEFENAVFEACDQWTKRISRRAYVRWLTSNLRAVTGIHEVAALRRTAADAEAFREFNRQALERARSGRGRQRLKAAASVIRARLRLTAAMSSGQGAKATGFAAAASLLAARLRLAKTEEAPAEWEAPTEAPFASPVQAPAKPPEMSLLERLRVAGLSPKQSSARELLETQEPQPVRRMPSWMKEDDLPSTWAQSSDLDRWLFHSPDPAPPGEAAPPPPSLSPPTVPPWKAQPPERRRPPSIDASFTQPEVPDVSPLQRRRLLADPASNPRKAVFRPSPMKKSPVPLSTVTPGSNSPPEALHVPRTAVAWLEQSAGELAFQPGGSPIVHPRGEFRPTKPLATRKDPVPTADLVGAWQQSLHAQDSPAGSDSIDELAREFGSVSALDVRSDASSTSSRQDHGGGERSVSHIGSFHRRRLREVQSFRPMPPWHEEEESAISPRQQQNGRLPVQELVVDRSGAATQRRGLRGTLSFSHSNRRREHGVPPLRLTGGTGEGSLSARVADLPRRRPRDLSLSARGLMMIQGGVALPGDS